MRAESSHTSQIPLVGVSISRSARELGMEPQHCSAAPATEALARNLLLLTHRCAGVKQWQKNQAPNMICCPGASAEQQSLWGDRGDATLRIPTLL